MAISKLISKGIAILSVVLVIWLFLSYVEIVTKNLKENPTYNENNLIIVIIDVMEEYTKCEAETTISNN